MQKNNVSVTTGQFMRCVFLSPLVVAPVALVLYLLNRTDDPAAWVQAVGSVGAILAAVVISMRQAQAAARLRREELESIEAGRTMRLYSLLYETCRALVQWVDQLEKIPNSRPDEGSIRLFERMLDRAIMNFDDDLDIKRQERLSEFRHVLGVVIHRSQQRMTAKEAGDYKSHVDTGYEALEKLLAGVVADIDSHSCSRDA